MEIRATDGHCSGDAEFLDLDLLMQKMQCCWRVTLENQNRFDKEQFVSHVRAICTQHEILSHWFFGDLKTNDDGDKDAENHDTSTRIFCGRTRFYCSFFEKPLFLDIAIVQCPCNDRRTKLIGEIFSRSNATIG